MLQTQGTGSPGGNRRYDRAPQYGSTCFQPFPVRQTDRDQAVALVMHDWLTRAAGPAISMLEFWQNETKTSLSLMRKVALRVGAFMISQCATERANKIPKAIWSTDRLRLTADHMCRDAFIYTNFNYYPKSEFDWSKVSRSGVEEID